MAVNLPISALRISEDIDALASLTEPGRPFTRRAFTPMFSEGRAYLRSRFAQAGLESRIDSAGNLIGRRAGRCEGKGTIMLGSHSDTVPDGGRFDGIAGVVAALEVARALDDRGIVLDHDLEVVDFLAEEVSIFGVSCVGSRGMAGVRPAEWLQRSSQGVTLDQALSAVGGEASRDAARTDIKAFLELHIEQGPVLEEAGLDIGIVTAIVGIARIQVTVLGQADHAGTTPMDRRKNALVAASRLTVWIDETAIARAAANRYFAATVGEFAIEPGAANVVPGKVVFLIDVRVERPEDFTAFETAFKAFLDGVAADAGVSILAETISENAPTPCDNEIVRVLENASVANGVTHRRMSSGAGHDAAWLAKVTKAGMVFVPCAGGRSHAPEEAAEMGDIALGAAVLFDAVQLLDKQLRG